MKTDTIVCVDFDSTLFDVDLFYHVHFRKAVMRCGLDNKIWDRTYNTTQQSGYCLDKHLKQIMAITDIKDSTKAQIKMILSHQFNDLRPYLFHDVDDFLTKCRVSGYKLHLLSLGDETWQRWKLKKCGIKSAFDTVVWTSSVGTKADHILKLFKSHASVIFIDNSSEELDVVKEISPEIKMYLICRIPQDQLKNRTVRVEFRWNEAIKHAFRIPKHSHIHCHELPELWKIL